MLKNSFRINKLTPTTINRPYMRYPFLRSALFILFLFYLLPAFCQQEAITSDLQKGKPAKFQNKTLKSEKTGDKKFTLPRRVSQNAVTHYNYYFNANNKLNAVVERARIANKDNYSKLLPFYGYSLTVTAAQKTELDSVIYKATAGILLHDLRNDWVDNLYLLIGKAYLLQKEFDSASMTFQFINYNLFPRKKKDDEQLIVGTNTNREGGNISIASKEKRNLLDKTFTLPPSRNDALVWQIRTLIEMKEYPDAAGLINTLQNDQNFPHRLNSGLEEMNAYWFYQQASYDSAASHLEKALSAADDREDKARWEFLLAQLFEITKQPDKASQYYARAIRNTTDPLLDIYANLNNAKLYKGKDASEVDNSIANLARMAKKDKFENYRDIIYYSAGELALEKKDTAGSQMFFMKSIDHLSPGSDYKSRSYLQLADIAFNQKSYKKAYAYYDSLRMTDDALIERKTEIESRKKGLAKIVAKINIIEREDSLQHIAAMSAADREAFIKNLLKQLRKQQGLKDEEQNTFGSFSSFNNNSQSVDLFSSNQAKGDWYFYNASIKGQGYSEFKSRWGNRVNVDNWRRRSALSTSISEITANNNNMLPGVDNKVTPAASTELSYDGLLSNVPLTDVKLAASNILLGTSLFELAKLYQEEMEDYRMAAQTYEASLQRFPEKIYGGEIYLDLYYCYQKLGDATKAAYYKNIVLTKFSNTKYVQFITNPQSLTQAKANPAATKSYENIYNLFIEGQFEKAVQEKKIADSLYGNNFWSPQLLYIESVYYIKQQQDSLAINTLNIIINRYPSSALKNKAVTMIDVLKRRKQIETYLTNLNVTRVKDDSVIVINDVPEKKAQVPKPIVTKVVQQTPPPQPVISGSFSFIAEAPQNVVMILDKVDPVYVSEARNAFSRYNRENYSAQTIDITKDAIDKDRNMLIFKTFADAGAAMVYADRIRKNAPAEVSWLPANKYSFIIISDANLEVLKANKDLPGYIKLLNTKYPGKF